jgi:hypothetical protein
MVLSSEIITLCITVKVNRNFGRIHRGADKSLVFPIFLSAAKTKEFLGWVKEVRITKS